ncbi:hypothetical protein P389DRAFT_178261 [Cystobasidium minutum MCA 4210]|uniref:uncharacterized protein n=1 Tax=Cystobasidium minutum MCA 4210 TaxID=1397322 RepID=UPI0034CF40F7|eukprot:jgi/Rhomi1/178261/fgenesh1_pg.2_\
MFVFGTFAALLAASATSMVASAPAFLPRSNSPESSSLQERDFWFDNLGASELEYNTNDNRQDKRIVINPHITYPDETAVWHTGQKGVNVTWDVPPNAEGYKGRLLLGYLLKNDSSGNEHLFLNPLADGFNLTDGRVTFDIPCNNEIKSRNTYVVVLMGDSGNKSGNFTIHREIDYCPNLKPKKPKTSTSNTATIAAASGTAASSSTGAGSGAAAASPASASSDPPSQDVGEDAAADSSEQA